MESRREVSLDECGRGHLGGDLSGGFLLPFAPTGLPWNDDFDATTLNYAPAIVAVFLVLVIWWILSASKTYEGPVSTIDFDEGLGITDEKEEPTARA
jgi:hypothetical protein